MPTGLGDLHLVGSFGPYDVSLTPGQEYSLFSLHIEHPKTVGTGACDGCTAPAAFLFRSLKLTTRGAGNPCDQAFGGTEFEIQPHSGTDQSWVAYYQGVPAGFSVPLDVPASKAPTGLQLLCANPIRDTGAIQLAVPRATFASLAVFDLAGRRRRVLLSGRIEAGTRALAWDGRGDDGQPLATGYYLLRLVTDEGAITRPLIQLH